MIRPTPLVIALAFGVAGCTSSVEPMTTAQVGEAFWVDVYGVRAIPAAALTIRFVEVLEDSRCPNDALVLCVWEPSAYRAQIRVVDLVGPPPA